MHKLKESIHGPKQSWIDMNWNKGLQDLFEIMHLCAYPANYCVVVRKHKMTKWSLFCGPQNSTDEALRVLKEIFTPWFKIKGLGKLKSFSAIDFTRDENCEKTTVCRENTPEVQRQDCYLRSTPCEQNLNYTNDTNVMTDGIQRGC